MSFTNSKLLSKIMDEIQDDAQRPQRAEAPEFEAAAYAARQALVKFARHEEEPTRLEPPEAPNHVKPSHVIHKRTPTHAEFDGMRERKKSYFGDRHYGQGFGHHRQATRQGKENGYYTNALRRW